MVELSRVIVPHLQDHNIQPVADPTDRAVLLRLIGTLIQIIRMPEVSCASSNPMPRFGFALNRSLFRLSKWKSMVV
jgi:hypothetical protein